MTSHSEKIEKLKTEAQSELEAVTSHEELDNWRIKYIGRKGAVPLILRGVKDLPLEEKRIVGKKANELRIELEASYNAKSDILSVNEFTSDTSAENNISNQELPEGHLHPLTLTIRRIEEIFSSIGFVSVEGPEVEEAKYNFDQLNIPLEHPARAETDTFYIKDQPDKNIRGLVLRTQTSPVQLRAVMEKNLTPPIKILSPGRVFRSEKTDPTHETTFHQFEGLVIDKDVSIADFKGVVETFYSTFFGYEANIRLRSSFFPFVEPGFEIDISCVFCKAKGCRVCKQSGWIEVMGAGMVHPNVLNNMDIDPKIYQGFAFGGSVERLTMLRHGINDLRLFWSGDIRFLKQFS